ncbi:hypothetical protein ABIC63_002766 [Pseudacidovorax sp. 1753]|uniref:chromosome partitioning protein ParB n=1 Tax=Pseudacidovorax sp. 1753 TaxID=3156419 RepID=UPI0033984F3D
MVTLDGVSKPLRRPAIGRRPAADPATAWMHRDEGGTSQATASVFTAGLTIDMTPALRGRIQVTACWGSVTLADMQRDLLTRAYPEERS